MSVPAPAGFPVEEPPVAPEAPEEDIADLMRYIQAGVLDIERALAGYMRATSALGMLTGTGPVERRRTGLPMLMYKAPSADGVKSTDVIVDLSFKDDAAEVMTLLGALSVIHWRALSRHLHCLLAAAQNMEKAVHEAGNQDAVCQPTLHRAAP